MGALTLAGNDLVGNAFLRPGHRMAVVLSRKLLGFAVFAAALGSLVACGNGSGSNSSSSTTTTSSARTSEEMAY
jgi:hypothetical protein